MARTIPTPESGFGNIYIDSLIGDHDGAKWDVASGPVTYSFDTWPAWTDAQKAMFRAVLDSYAAVCGLTFSEVDFSTRANLVEQKRYSLPNASAWHQTPLIDEYPTLYGQYTGLDNPYTGLENPWIWPGSADYSTVVHEIGHAMNLARPHDGGWGSGRTIFPGATNSRYLGDDAMNQGIWTVMSYIRGRAGHYGYSSLEPAYFVGDVITPMALDVAALQAMYGVNTAWRTGDDVYRLPTANVPGTGWTCIWDAGGSDTISNAGVSRDCTINLMDAPLVGPNAGGYVSWNKVIVGGFTIAHGAVIENAIGGNGDDTITGNDANNVLQGGAGNDVLAGGLGNDVAIFSGSRDGYAIVYRDGTYTITGADGVDQVTAVETFRFSDGSFTPAKLFDHAATGEVSISGTPTEGQLLRAANTMADMDGLGPVSYQWMRSDSEIAGATAAAYLLTQDDVGKSISVRASAMDGLGIWEHLSSAATAAVANINNAPTGKLGISGGASASMGNTISAVNALADLDGMGKIHYQWLRAGSAIAGAEQGSYTLTKADVGKNISVRAGWTDGYGAQESVTSNATRALADINDAPLGRLTISGTPQQGQSMSATRTLTDADGLGVISYQWQADGVNIGSAKGARFTLDAAQVGAAISVVAYYVDAKGVAERVASAATPYVEASETFMRTAVHADSMHNEWPGSDMDALVTVIGAAPGSISSLLAA